MAELHKIMSLGRLPRTSIKATFDVEHMGSASGIQHEFWPLAEINPQVARFPCCLVWTPLPVVSWLAPFIGHVGICREDGVILDFSGSNFINIDDFAFGAPARYIQLEREKVWISNSRFLVVYYCAWYLFLSLFPPVLHLSYCT